MEVLCNTSALKKRVFWIKSGRGEIFFTIQTFAKVVCKPIFAVRFEKSFQLFQHGSSLKQKFADVCESIWVNKSSREQTWFNYKKIIQHGRFKSISRNIG